MPRRLIIMRHARSAWEGPGSSDHERPLDERGRFEAPRVASRLVELGWIPEAIHSSDARRTRETAELLLEVLSPAPEPTFDPDLYLAGLPALRAAAMSWSPSWSTVLALGHNPGWQDAASALCGSVLGMSTADAVLLETPPGAPSGWPEALDREWSLVDVLRPGDL